MTGPLNPSRPVPEPERTCRVTLAATAGPLRGQAFEFARHDTFLFGRAEECHARLAEEDAAVSRLQFLLEVNPPCARLRDLGSLNGTHVNGVKHGGRERHESPEDGAHRVHPQIDLRHGDEIRVGATIFSVRVEPAPECCRCQRALPAEYDPATSWDGQAWHCPTCRANSQAEPLPAATPGAATGAAFEVSFRSAADGEALGSDPTALRAVAGYDLERLLGKGGMGAVYLARRRSDGQLVALKVALAHIGVDEQVRDAFRREIEITRSLRHASIVALLDYGELGRGYYFAMEYCAGGCVLDMMEERLAPLQAAEAVTLALVALDGLAFAHAQGVVHRDLKPENLLLADARRREAKISDFGLAKSFEQAGLSGMTATGTFGGTYHFMPREQLTHFRSLRPVSDVWSMGATLYFMLTGRFTRDFPPGIDPLQVILKGGIVPIRNRDPRLPAALARVVDRAVADDFNERHQSAAEFRDELARARP